MATNPSALPDNSGRITAPTTAYPYGSAKADTTGTAGDGTPFSQALLNDDYGFKQWLLNQAGIVPSGNADTALVSQYGEALLSLITRPYNAIRNPRFNVNQRGVTGTVTLAPAEYGHDGWGGGATGCTYTFFSTGGVTQIDITSGSLKQVIEADRVNAGVNTLYYIGTAQGRINGGAYGDTGDVSAALDGGSNVSVEFGVGTVSRPKLEQGGFTGFEVKSYQEDLNENQYYLWVPGGTLTLLVGCRLINSTGASVNTASFMTDWSVPTMRTVPSIVTNGNVNVNGGSGTTIGTLSAAPILASNNRSRMDCNFTAFINVNAITQLRFFGRPYVTAELAL